MSRELSIQEANQSLKKLMVGKFIARFTTGNVWTLMLDDDELRLSFHAMTFPLKDALVQRLSDFNPELLNCPDSEDVAWAAMLAAVTRREITSATVDDQAQINLSFEGGIEVTVSTDANIVDWQWCIGRSEVNHPYTSPFEIACFWKGEIRGS